MPTGQGSGETWCLLRSSPDPKHRTRQWWRRPELEGLLGVERAGVVLPDATVQARFAAALSDLKSQIQKEVDALKEKDFLKKETQREFDAYKEKVKLLQKTVGGGVDVEVGRPPEDRGNNGPEATLKNVQRENEELRRIVQQLLRQSLKKISQQDFM